jgi:hypothetical protein
MTVRHPGLIGRAAAAALAAGTLAVMLACGGAVPTQNPETFNVKSGKEVTRYITFNQGVNAEIWVSSEKDSDVDLFVFDDTGKEVAKDDGLSKDCHVSFTPERTQMYKVSIQNRVHNHPEQKGRNGDNRCTLKWSP